MNVLFSIAAVAIAIGIPVMWLIVEMTNDKIWIRLLFGMSTICIVALSVHLISNSVLATEKAKANQTLHYTAELLKAGKHQEVINALESKDARQSLIDEINKRKGSK